MAVKGTACRLNVSSKCGLLVLLTACAGAIVCSQLSLLVEISGDVYRMSSETEKGASGKQNSRENGSGAIRAGDTRKSQHPVSKDRDSFTESSSGAQGLSHRKQGTSDLQLVVCTRVRNEAPYLTEWLEYHRMIGFEKFLIMNDNSTDDTQCILDAYAGEGIVIRIPEDISNTTGVEREMVFDFCADYIQKHPNIFHPQRTWMMTHDTDEFVWFNRTENVTALSDAIENLIQRHGQVVQSLPVPRLLFGSSGQEHYSSELVVDRFTRRFNLDSCPKRRRYSKHFLALSAGLRARDKQQGKRRRLFDHTHPISYCDNRQRRNSYDLAKSISLASSLALSCTQEKVETPCSTTHKHTLKNQRQVQASRHARVADKRFLHERIVGTTIEILHYMTKSRDEFLSRVCSSVWQDKYNRCPTCSPESYFNLTKTYADNFEDNRMASISADLQPILESSKISAGCNTQPIKPSPECFH